MKPGVQGEREDPFAFIKRLNQEMKRMRMLLQAVRGGRFRGRKPNGDWWVTITPKLDPEGNLMRGRESRDLRASSPVELVLLAAVARCFVCGCDTDAHSQREPTELEAQRLKDTKRCEGQRLRGVDVVQCSCARTPQEIRKKQSDREWLAERLAELMRRREMEGHRDVKASTVFQGLREAAIETQASEA